MVRHQYVDVSIKVVIVRSTFDDISTVIAEKLKAINDSWKDVWPRLDVLEASCESLKEQIKRKVGSQVNFNRPNNRTLQSGYEVAKSASIQIKQRKVFEVNLQASLKLKVDVSTVFSCLILLFDSDFCYSEFTFKKMKSLLS